jgi:DNA-binding CsgD family transcriptional regulator
VQETAFGALSSSFHLHLPAPVICDAAQLRQFFDPGRLLGYARHHDVRQLLLLGSAEQLPSPPHWLLLARRGRLAFSTAAADYATAAWPHLLRCNRIYQDRYLASKASICGRGGFAVISLHDAIEAADSEFERIAQCEWPASQPGQLPAAVLATLRRLGKYEGRLANWTRENGPVDAYLCHVVEHLPVDSLTPAEAVVARHYAQGRTHGEIAALLGISSNTVRTHLAHVFSKLDIHRKSELAAHLR